MKKIEEVFLERKMVFQTNDPYQSALDIFHILRQQEGKLETIKNIYETDGPRKRIEIRVHLIRPFEKFSKTVLDFDIKGEFSEISQLAFLSVEIKGSFIAELNEDTGFMGESFFQFYMQRIFPHFRDKGERKAKLVEREIELRIRELARPIKV